MTLPTLLTWVDFDDDGNDTGATVIGANGVAIAVAMDTPYQDEFLQLIAATPDMQAALTIALEAISAVPNYRVPGHTGGSYAIASLIEQALTKAKGA